VGFLDRVLGRTPAPGSVRKLDAAIVHAGGLLGVVGESHRQDALSAISRQTTDAGPYRNELVDFAAEVADDEPERRWFRAVLVREPDNPHDAEAIAVHAQGGGLLGYLKREDARRYAQVFQSLEKRGFEAAACPAMLMGGGEKSYGVVLAISAPEYVLNALTADES
jgi:HIRAN domain-containing protein